MLESPRGKAQRQAQGGGEEEPTPRTGEETVQETVQETDEAETNAELVAELMARCRDPLLVASCDLQSRIDNVVHRGFLRSCHCHGSDFTKECAQTHALAKD